MTLKAFLFGITMALAIGPIALLIMQRGIQHGIGRAFASALGAALADGFYGFVVFLLGLSLLPYINLHRAHIEFVCGLLLLAVGTHIIVTTLRPKRRLADGCLEHQGRFRKNDCLGVFLLTLSNPLTVFTFIGFLGHVESTAGFASAFFLGLMVFLGSLLVQTAIAILGAYIGQLLRNRYVTTILSIVSGIGIASFGIWQWM